ncbi:MAG TPA: SDR family oxidoreductase [Geobacteraceae bacterium]
MKLEGKVALVTGAGVRIGREIALALAARGVILALHYGTSVTAAEETAALVRALGSEAEHFQADLRDTTHAAGLVERAAGRFGHVDILVNSAAIFLSGDLAETTEENWDAHFGVNLKAPFFLCRAFARHVGGEREGCIINIADWRAVRPGPHHLAYTLTKSGIVTLTESLALALAPNVRVNAIAPGAILPPPGADDAHLARLATRIPLRRSGSPAEVTRALIYLLEADFVTGELLFVDGGERLM